jgi:hypothetical protein
MNTVELEGNKVLVRPSQAVSIEGKKVVIGDERQSRMIRPKNLKIGRWKKKERSMPRSHPKSSFDILMAKYRDGKADIMGHKNQTIRFSWIRPELLWQKALPTTNTGHRHGEIQNVEIIINMSII